MGMGLERMMPLEPLIPGVTEEQRKGDAMPWSVVMEYSVSLENPQTVSLERRRTRRVVVI